MATGSDRETTASFDGESLEARTGRIKALFDVQDRTLSRRAAIRSLGATIVGSHAGDMISEITVAMQAGMGLGKLASVIHPYPTAAIRQCGDAYNRSRLPRR